MERETLANKGGVSKEDDALILKPIIKDTSGKPKPWEVLKQIAVESQNKFNEGEEGE